jgi:hypothetical protein
VKAIMTARSVREQGPARHQDLLVLDYPRPAQDNVNIDPSQEVEPAAHPAQYHVMIDAIQEHFPSDAVSKAWLIVARQQGIVCVVCGSPPALERRAEFYDTGLCRSCAAQIDAEPTKKFR